MCPLDLATCSYFKTGPVRIHDIIYYVAGTLIIYDNCQLKNKHFVVCGDYIFGNVGQRVFITMSNYKEMLDLL